MPRSKKPDSVSMKEQLETLVQRYQQPGFISDDPIGIPHRFTRKQDIEIAGLFAALLAWGNRTSILRSCNRILDAMEQAPYDFIMQPGLFQHPNHTRNFRGWVHRTFNEHDLLFILQFLHHHYFERKESSLETAFSQWMHPEDPTVEQGLNGFYHYVFGYCAEAADEIHCRKHIAAPEKKSACKRLNMYLRWMVRPSGTGVDFGLWNQLHPRQLLLPLDVHVSRVARKMNLLQRKQNDWQAVLELTDAVRSFHPNDPARYDFALYGLGLEEKYGTPGT